MGLSTTEIKKLTEFRKWVKTQRRRYRLNPYPKFSFGVDGRTKKILYRYSVNKIIGYDKEKDEPITARKKLNGYTTIPLSDYQLINVRGIFNKVKKNVARFDKVVQSDSKSLPHWIEEYVSVEIRNGIKLSNSTKISDRYCLTNYMEWLNENKPAYLDVYRHIDDGKKVFEEYLIYLSKSKTRFGKSPSKNTLANTYRRVKGFFNWLSENDNSFPYNMLKLKGWGQERNKDKLPPATSLKDMKILIRWMDENCENKYERHFIPVLRMLLITGCRISEVVGMKIKDVDVDKKVYEFFSKGSWRTIKLDSDTLWRDLEYWIFDKKGKVRTDKEYVFHCEYWRKPNKSNGVGGGVKIVLDKHISKSGVAHKFKKVIIELGLNPKLTPHSCRRGFITYMLEKTNGNVPLVASLAGHKSWEMVYRYNRERLPKERTTIDLGEVLKGD